MSRTFAILDLYSRRSRVEANEVEINRANNYFRLSEEKKTKAFLTSSRDSCTCKHTPSEERESHKGRVDDRKCANFTSLQ